MIKPTMSMVKDKTHLNELLIDYYQKRNTELYHWLRTLYEASLDYVEYEHNGDPNTEDARAMKEMELDELNNLGILSKINKVLEEG